MPTIQTKKSNIIVYNSITNTLNDQKYDSVQPFSFIEFLNFTPSLNGSALQFSDYQNYLKIWNSVTTTLQVSYDATVRQEFINFLKTITLNYTTAEEKRYLSNIDFYNNDDLEIAVPFFVEKIKQVLLYFANKRETYKIDLQLAKSKGSVAGVNNYLKTYIVETLFGNENTIPITSTTPLSTVSNNLSIEIEEGYDIFNDYFDLDPFLPPDFYQATGQRAKYFSANTNIDDPNLFLDYDQAIINLINSERPVLQELQSLVISVDTPDINLLQPHDFIDYTNVSRSNIRLVLNAQLIKDFTGTDFYYLSATSNGTISGLLFEATSPYANLLNIYNPTTLTVPQSSVLYERDVGLFFKPNNQSILQLQSPFNYTIKPDISDNHVYIFPDPSSYGNIVGLTRTDHETPFSFTTQGELIQKNISSNNALGNSYVTNNDFTFESYHSVEQNSTKSFLQNLYNAGVATTNVSDIYGNLYVGLKQQNTGYIQTFTNNVSSDTIMFGLSTTTSIPFSGSILQVLNSGTFANTSSQENSTPNYTPLNTIYNTRTSPGNFIVYNLLNNTVNPLSSEFNNIIAKYPIQSTDIQNLLINCEMYGNTFVLTTSSFVIVDNFFYNSGNFLPSSNLPLILNSVINNKASNVYLNGNNLYIVSLSSTDSPLTSSNNTRNFYLSLNSYNLNNNTITDYNFAAPADYIFSYNFNTLVNVTNINLVYNKLQDLYNVVISLKDLNNSLFLHSLFLRISNNQVSIINQKMFAPTNTNITVNFYDGSYTNNIYINPITTVPTINYSNGTLTF